MSCNAAFPRKRKKAAKLPFWWWLRSAGCWRVCWRVLVLRFAKLRSFEAKNQDALRALRNPALWIELARSCGPCRPQSSRRRTGDASPGPSDATKKGPRRNATLGQPTATTDGVAAETAPLLPAPRQRHRTARLHALRRAAAAARLGPPVERKARHGLPPERDTSKHGLGLFSPPRFRFPAAEFIPTTTPTAPVSVRSRKCGA